MADHGRTRRDVLVAGSSIAVATLAGCSGNGDDTGGSAAGGDDSGDPGGSSDQQGGDDSGTTGSLDLAFEGQLDNFDGEEGEITADFIHTNSAPQSGYLESDGSFSVSIPEEDLEPEDETDFGEPITIMESLNLRCDDEVAAQTGDARFTWFTHLRVADIDREEVSFITAMTEPEGCEPSFANCPAAEAEYVTWVYSTEDVDVQATCDGEEIDLTLTRGWNVVLQDEHERHDQRTVSIDSLEEALETVDWYYNDQ